MTHRKTEHGTQTTGTQAPSGARRGVSSTRPATLDPAALIEACDRLGEKLDQLATLAQAVAQGWQQDRQASSGLPGTPEAEAALRDTRKGAGVEGGPGAKENDAGTPDAAAERGAGAEARRLVDAFSRSQAGWPEQAADLREAMKAIMGFLENQAAAAPAKLDLSDILGRLQSLEEQQRNLQSQVAVNRWGQ